MRRRLAVAFVLVDPVLPGTIIGYYTLNMSAVAAKRLSDVLIRRLGRYPDVPAVLIGRLAVSTAYQGQGFGATLLFDALARTLALGQEAGCLLVVVDALDERAAAYYERYDFQRFLDQADKLFITLDTAEAIFKQAT